MTSHRPSLPWEGPPLPRFLELRWPWSRPTPARPNVQYGQCDYGLECIKNHMLRAHLFMTEALRFSADGSIPSEAQQKIIQAREQLLCEDDFARAMEAPPAIKAQVLQLLASTRSTWKAIERSGIDQGWGNATDIQQAASALESLYHKAYDIDRQYRALKEAR